MLLLNKRGIKTLTETDRMCHVTDVYQMRSVLCYILEETCCAKWKEKDIPGSDTFEMLATKRRDYQR
ncbi:MAG: hypothetical protein QY310_15045 [Candidatus Jettenia sp. CY-1]|nr:hypothetical protein [Candidatus Jettenia sp.]WKZ18722.1 MAG: hypothetical protein QY310_15045 [Candidatus Jettenia sp. CY-1]